MTARIRIPRLVWPQQLAALSLCAATAFGQTPPTPPGPDPILPPQSASHDEPGTAVGGPKAADPKAADPSWQVNIQGTPTQRIISREPAAPASSSRAQAGMPPDPALEDRRLPALKGDEPSLKPFVLHTRIGINEVVRLSSSYLNRISTPFTDPVLIDISDAPHKIMGSEIYFMPKGDEPVGLYVFDKKNPSQAISLTVVPVRGIPGQNVLVKIENFRALGRLSLTEPSSGDGGVGANTPPDHEGQLTQILVGAIQGRIPGFSPVPLEAGTARLDGVLITPDVVFQGYYLDVYRYELRNESDRSVALNEGVFYREGVKAVSFFPLDRLEPSQSTFVFIAARKSVDPSPQDYLSEGDLRVRSGLAR